MSIGRFLGCVVVGIIFGFMGAFSGEGFLNYGSITMGLFSIPSIFVGNKFKRRKK